MSRAEFRGTWPDINAATQQVKAERCACKRNAWFARTELRIPLRHLSAYVRPADFVTIARQVMSGKAGSPRRSRYREIWLGLVPVRLTVSLKPPLHWRLPTSLPFCLVGPQSKSNKRMACSSVLSITFHTDIFKYYIGTLDRDL